MRSFVGVLLVLGACAGSDGAQSVGDVLASPAPNRSEAISVPLSLYVVVADDEARSSQRTPEGLESISERMNEIWAPAGIVFDPVEVAVIDVPNEVLAGLALGDTEPFLDQAGRTFDVPDPGAINGFYVRDAGGPNGFTPFGTRVFFVDDDPTVHDERVSSHEVGHLLGLRHALDDPDRLMFSGTNGMALTTEERDVARYGADGLLERAN